MTKGVSGDRGRALWENVIWPRLAANGRGERILPIAQSVGREWVKFLAVVESVKVRLRYGDIFSGLLKAIRSFEATKPHDDAFAPASLKGLQDAEISDMVFEDKRGVWVAKGADPRFAFNGPFRAGFYRVRWLTEVSGLRPAVAAEAKTEIFVDFGGGFSPKHVFVYPVIDGKISIDDILPLRADAAALRFDPINSQCEIKIAEFSLRPAPLDCVASWMSARFRAQRGDLGAFPTAYARAAEVRAALRNMSAAVAPGRNDYQGWVEANAMTPERREKLAAEVASRADWPLISVLTPTYRSDLTYLQRAIDSVLNQIYVNWELCLVDDGSGDPQLTDFLQTQAGRDPRIKFKASPVNGGISAANNLALGLSSGAFVAFLDHDDELAPHALLSLAKAILTEPQADMIYSDEDKIDANGRRSDPLFKPDWSPQTMLGCMYTCHLSAYRRSLIDEIGGFRSEFDLAQDYDLALRISRKARQIVHIADVLYHWRTLPRSTAASASAKPTAEIIARRAIQDHLDASGMGGRASAGPFAGSHRISLDLRGAPLASLVIPTAARRIGTDEKRWYVLDLLKSVREISSYRNYEIVLVENGDIEPDLKEALAEFPITYVRYDAPQFNYSEKVNLGVAAAAGEFVILLNDDMSILTPDWMEQLISWLQRPGIAATGAKLLFPNRTVQHAGVLMLGQGPSHVYYGHRDSVPGQFGGAVLLRNYSAVTGACLAVKKQDYEAISGFDPSFRVNYNDVDFCLRLRSLGRIVYLPDVKLVHYESVSRDPSPDDELSRINDKWASVMGFDPYYNRNLSQYTPYRALARAREDLFTSP